MLSVVLRFALALFIYIGNITNFLSAVIIRVALSLAEVIEHPEEIQILDVDPETLRARHYRLRVLPDPAPTPPPVEVPAAEPREAAEPSEPAPPRHQYALRPRAPVFVRVTTTTNPSPDIRGVRNVAYGTQWFTKQMTIWRSTSLPAGSPTDDPWICTR